MPGRPHKDRLRKDFDEIRKELSEEVGRAAPEEFDWAPRPGMKTIRALLLEIGTMEKVCMHWVQHRSILDWKETEGKISWSDNTPQSALEALAQVRQETLGYLEGCSEEQLQTPIPIPEEWRIYWGTSIEPEEALRWVARHEYYHLGQIISYRWILGDNPYKRG